DRDDDPGALDGAPYAHQPVGRVDPEPGGFAPARHVPPYPATDCALRALAPHLCRPGRHPCRGRVELSWSGRPIDPHLGADPGRRFSHRRRLCRLLVVDHPTGVVDCADGADLYADLAGVGASGQPAAAAEAVSDHLITRFSKSRKGLSRRQPSTTRSAKSGANTSASEKL